MKICLPSGKRARRNRAAHAVHNVLEILQVVPCQQHARDHFLRTENVVQIGARVFGTGGAAAIFIQRARIIRVAGVLDVQHTAARKYLARPARTAGQYTVHHVDPSFYGAHDIIRLTDAHQIPRLIHRKLIWREIKDVEHRLLPLAHGQTADSVAVKFDPAQRLGGARAQVFFQPALLNTKQRVARTVPERITRPLRPPHRHLHAFGDPLAICGQRGAFVKAHHNVRAEQLLNFHRPFRRQLMLGPVNVGFKRNAMFRHFAQIRQRHHLKPTAVGQDRLVPIHELMQAAQVGNPLRRGA